MSKLTPTEVFIHIAIRVKDPAFWALHDLCITMSALRGNAVLDALRPLSSTHCNTELRRGASRNACQHGGLARASTTTTPALRNPPHAPPYFYLQPADVTGRVRQSHHRPPWL
ncbi:hypothetical protein DND47_27205 [Pseudomonas syringae pv. syringae]|nr:hypothetical protein DND47_27205 [Pseudomonas syringae pv. syringae]